MRLSSVRIVLFLIVCIGFAVPKGMADVKLPSLFSENMVLQAGARDPIWGTADPNEKITVTLGEARATTTADAAGNWKLELGPLQPGGPFTMTVAGKNTIKIHNVLVGQVWLCSGQSNMTFSLAPHPGWWETGVQHYRKVIASANHPRIHMFTVAETVAGKPQKNVAGHWDITSPVTASNFSAVAYFFGLDLFKDLHEPIGLIHNSWPGTPAESWTTMATLKSRPEFADILKRWQKENLAYPAAIARYNQALHKWEQATKRAEAAGSPLPPAPRLPHDPRSDSWRPAGLFNAMIAPLIPYRIKGAIWYQGESNTDRPIQYRKLFPDMIRDWRQTWGEGNFPFIFVQIAAYQLTLPPASWPLLREAQLKTLSLPNTAMVVTIDVGSPAMVHPRNKKIVGRRLSLAARALAYDQKVIYSGPIYSSMQIEGNKIRLHFTHLGGGLVALHRFGTPPGLEGFEIASANHKFVGARAMIEGNTVVVESNRVPHPVAVRYAWQDYPICNLYNQAGLPASPFRTDDWAQ